MRYHMPRNFVCYPVMALPEGTLDNEHEVTPNNLHLAGHSLPQIEFDTAYAVLFSLCLSSSSGFSLLSPPKLSRVASGQTENDYIVLLCKTD